MADPSDRRAIRRAPATGDVMPARRPRPEPDELDEGPLQQDIERFNNPTRDCPSCGKEVFDDSALCYHCGHAFTGTAAGTTKAKPWVVIVIVLIVAAFVLGALRGLF